MPHSDLSLAPRSAFRFEPGAWDRFGVALSGLCAAHCLALPVLLLALPCEVLGATLHEALHPAIAAFLVPVTLRAARNAPGAGLLHAGLALVWLAVPTHAFLGECLGLLLTLVGSGLLISGHRTNLFCRHREAMD
ncbi:MAG: MerC family mercury resistance protein [Rhodothermaceae bacterium]|nr:MerC family mercury resistance protein [Rhodothermaceae bacterium]